MLSNNNTAWNESKRSSFKSQGFSSLQLTLRLRLSLMIFMLVAACAVLPIAAFASPAQPIPALHEQPDGSTVTVTLHGDEWFHYATDLHENVLMQDETGAWWYVNANEAGEINLGAMANDEASSAYVAAGANYPDALACSAAGGKANSPVLLVPAQAAKVPSELSLYIKTSTISKLRLSGGMAAVPLEVEWRIQQV